jgi:S-methylmethionine-dependent homocysteine/selenocysteine methylase
MTSHGEATGAIAAKLARGAVVVLDGATGTELQRRGVPMDDAAWCALATVSTASCSVACTRTTSAPAPTS